MAPAEPAPMRIAIAAAGRYHVLDLARELDALGHAVRFYSYVPRRRARRFGLPARCHVALLPWLAPLVLFARLTRASQLLPPVDRAVRRALDSLVAWKLEPCDVFIGMSGIYVKAPQAARKRFNAKIVLERGSTHVLTQQAILERVAKLNPGVKRVNRRSVARELRGYALADRIAVPSRHAQASFADHGIEGSRVFRNPYGVDLSMFKPDPGVPRDPRLLLFVGGWSYQKGVDVLVEAMATLGPRGYTLRHVGAVGDAPVPEADWFRATGAVDQSELPGWYNQARCLVLPSRQEGLALVQIQALACGCPVIGSEMTGARDLAEAVAVNGAVQTVPVEDPVALVEAIERAPEALDDATTRNQLAARFSWAAYAKRYESMLADLTHDGPAQESAT